MDGNELVIKALSNPERLRLLAALRVEGETTVGMLCEKTGCAPGSASYHLRKLAEAGLVEKSPRDGGDRRESWWKACGTSTSIAVGGDDPESSGDDESLLLRATELSYGEAYERYLAARDALPVEWKRAEVGMDTGLCLTPAELEELGSELSGVLERWSKRCEGRQPRDGKDRVVAIVRGFRWVP